MFIILYINIYNIYLVIKYKELYFNILFIHVIKWIFLTVYFKNIYIYISFKKIRFLFLIDLIIDDI